MQAVFLPDKKVIADFYSLFITQKFIIDLLNTNQLVLERSLLDSILQIVTSDETFVLQERKAVSQKILFLGLTKSCLF